MADSPIDDSICPEESAVREALSGSMGVVYAAHDPELDRKLALKLLHPGSDQVEKSGGQAASCGGMSREPLGGRMRKPVLLSAVVLAVVISAVPASSQLPLPWPAPASPPLPPDLTVPYLPAVAPVSCVAGQRACFDELEAELLLRTKKLGCDHDAVFSDAYRTITRTLIDATTAGFFDRPDRITHEARNYAQEYFDQYDRWHAGDLAGVSPAWRIAFSAAQEGTVTALGDLLLQLNAHIRRDNPIRAVEQTEGVLRLEGPMPAASGRPDHDRVSEVLAETLELMLDRLAERYDLTIDDGADLFGRFMDQEALHALISAWREESWRNAEALRHARFAGGVNGPLYQAKLAEIEEAARNGAEAIKAMTLTTPAQNAAREAYCVDHL